jgi:hypothetical protein
MLDQIPNDLPDNPYSDDPIPSPYQSTVDKLLAEADIIGAIEGIWERLHFLSYCSSHLRWNHQEVMEQMLVKHRGKVAWVNWNAEHKVELATDTEDAYAYTEVTNITLHLDDGRNVPLGDLANAFARDNGIDDFIALDYPESRILAETLKSAGADEDEVFTATVATMIGIPVDQACNFLDPLFNYIDNHRCDKSLTFGKQGVQPIA